MLPQNILMSMRIERYDSTMNLVEAIQINDDISNNYFSGKRAFVTFAGETAKMNIVEYKVGFK